MPKIFVIDIETTGLKHSPDSHVIEVGICSYDTDSGSVEEIYSSLVGYDVTQWSDFIKNEWVFTWPGHSLDPEDLADQPSLEVVRHNVQSILKDQYATSYHRAFDFDEFLSRDPWNIECREAPCIMLCAKDSYPQYCSEKHYAGGFGADYAYQVLCPGDPAGIEELPKHRALADAKKEAYVLKHLYENGFYKLGE